MRRSCCHLEGKVLVKYGIPDKDLNEILDEIKKNLGQTKNPHIFIYGSRVKGGYRDYSDIDLLLRAESFDQSALAAIDFGNLDTAFKIDLVLEPELYEGYREEVLGHMVEIG